MRLTMLDGLRPSEPGEAVLQALHAAGVDVIRHRLRDRVYAPCRGCFGCWVEHPGICATRDAGNDTMRDIIGADVVLFLTEPRFGGWDPICKAALDRSIGLISPFFRKIHGETHHHARYRSYPRWWVLGQKPSDLSLLDEDRFQLLVARNALNLHSEAPRVGFFDEAPQASALVEGWLQDSSGADASFPVVGGFAPSAPLAGPDVQEGAERTAVLLVGSAKDPGTSSSEALGRALLRRLEARRWSTRVVQISRTVKLRRHGAPRLQEALEGADLVVLATPVYVDSLPALVTAGLAHLVDAGALAHTRWLPIVNCGFPELEHTTLALELVERAVQVGGGRLAGHLAVAAGGLFDGQALDGMGGRTLPQREALEQAADALTAGEPVPASASARFGETFMGPGLYRAAGAVGWLWQAYQNGAIWQIADRPLAPGSGPASS